MAREKETEEPQHDIPDYVREPLVIPDVNGQDFDEVLDFTQKSRTKLVAIMDRNLEHRDSKDLSVFLKALSDMDKGVTTKRRLKVEEASQASSEAEIRNTTELLRAVTHSVFQAAPGTVVPREAPSLDDSIPEPDLVPGEVDQGVAVMTYDGFKKSLPQTEES